MIPVTIWIYPRDMKYIINTICRFQKVGIPWRIESRIITRNRVLLRLLRLDLKEYHNSQTIPETMYIPVDMNPEDLHLPVKETGWGR
jgi:hypothetical protein